MGRNTGKFNSAADFIMFEKGLSLSLVNHIDDHCADNLLEVKFISWYVRIQTERMGHLHGSTKESGLGLPQKGAVDRDEIFHEEESVGLPSKSMSMKESKLYAPFHTYSNEWLVSWFLTLADYYLSLAKRFSLFDVSGMFHNQKTEAPKTPLSTAEKSVQKNFEDQSFGIANETGVDSPVNFSDSEWSSRNSPGTEKSVSSSSSGYASSPISYSERVSYMVSLINLDGEDWSYGSDSDVGCLQDHDFPSPSSKSTQVLSPDSISSSGKQHFDRSSNHSILSSGNDSQTSQTIDLEDVHADEPLFWPFEKKINWCPEDSSTCFPISPRKNKLNNTHLFEKRQSFMGAAYFHNPKLKAEKGIRRKLVYGSGSTTSKTTKRNQVEKKAVRNSKIVSSSRLGKSYPERLTKIPGVQSRDRRAEARERQVPANRSSSITRNLLDTEPSIETLLGLREFDGHEGIDPEFNGDAFSFGDYL